MGKFMKNRKPFPFENVIAMVFNPDFSRRILQDTPVTPDVMLNLLAANPKNPRQLFWTKWRTAPAVRFCIGNLLASQTANNFFRIGFPWMSSQKRLYRFMSFRHRPLGFSQG